MRNIPYQSENAPSFREASAWVCLCTTLAVYIPYFAYIYHVFSQEPWRGGLMMGRALEGMMMAFAIHILLNTAAHIYLSVKQRPESRDERDDLIEARSFQYAYRVLATSLLGVVFAVPGCVAQSRGHITTFPFVIQMVWLSFVAAEVVKYFVRAVSYRRSR